MNQFQAAARLVSRRSFLQSSCIGATGAVVTSRVDASLAANAADDIVSFFVIGDSHYLADKTAPTKQDQRSIDSTGRFMAALKTLPGSTITAEAGGGQVRNVQGLLHCGDIVDSADKNGGVYPEIQKTEFAKFEEDYGLKGGDGKLPYPVYELHGNHDGPRGTGYVIDQIKRRNASRPGVVSVAENGLHYSWDWGSVHCVSLGINVSPKSETGDRRKYDSLGSLEFLRSDLAKHVGDSGRPVVLAHHIDIARHLAPCDPNAKPDEWDNCDVFEFYDALKNYRIAAIFYGHTHARVIYKWDGKTILAKSGIDVFNVEDSSHFASTKQGLFYVELGGGKLTVREFATNDNWRTHAWTPRVWTSEPTIVSKN